MGIVVLDSIVTPQGANVTNCYISFAMNAVTIIPATSPVDGSKVFYVNGPASTYFNAEARESNKQPLQTREVRVGPLASLANTDVYTILYNDLKQQYPNNADAVEEPAVEEPAVEEPAVEQPVP